MNQFNYWTRGYYPPKLSKVGRNENELWRRLYNGDFAESKYWRLSNLESRYLEEDIRKWRKKNPRASKESEDLYRVSRRKNYNVRREKLREAHQEYEIKRLSLLKKLFIKTFGEQLYQETILNFGGNERELFEELQQRKNGLPKNYERI